MEVQNPMAVHVATFKGSLVPGDRTVNDFYNQVTAPSSARLLCPFSLLSILKL